MLVGPPTLWPRGAFTRWKPVECTDHGQVDPKRQPETMRRSRHRGGQTICASRAPEYRWPHISTTEVAVGDEAEVFERIPVNTSSV